MKRLIVLGALALYAASVNAPTAPAHSAQCTAVRAVFYTSSDWARLAQGLAADPSSCAQYYISIDPLTANKTIMRPNAAQQVDALGPQFHALAEVNFAAWQSWVNSTGNSWYAAGQAARSAMDTAGFNMANGDTWAINEFPSSVRTDTGGARENVEQFVQGLYAGNGSDGTAQGIVFMIGVGQTGTSLAQYKASLESWFQDTTFWTTMAADVSDFFYETYGDVRTYAVAGESPAERAGYLNDFLQHPLELVTAPGAPATTAAAASFLTSAYGPLANASWAWNSDYGWTQVTSATMADYISAQTYAMRSFPGATRIGFAWNPLNTQGLDLTDFNTNVAGVLARLAGSIHETDGGDPSQACEATGCSAVLAGAAPATGWSTFTSWAPTVAAFASASQRLLPGTPSEVMTVVLETGNVDTTLPVPTSLTLTSSSHTGEFATTPAGPWTPSLTLTIPAGSQTASFYTEDSTGGSPTLTTTVAGGGTATQGETVVVPATTTTAAPPPPPPATVTSLSFTPQNNRMHTQLRVVSGSGQPLEAQVDLALLVGTTTVATTSGTTDAAGWLAFTATPALERGCYRVEIVSVEASGYAWDGSSPSGSDCVTTLPMQIGGVTFTPLDGRMHVGLRVVNASGQPLPARVRLSLVVGSSEVTTTSATTSADGWLGITAQPLLARGCYHVRVEGISAAGYAWNEVAPTQSLCVTTLPAHVGAVTFTRRKGHLHVALKVEDAAGAPVRATVAFTVLRGTVVFAATRGETSGGQIGITARGKLTAGCYTVRVSAVTAAGYAWDRVAPTASYCVARP